MNKHKISSSSQTVPFSWEHLPGISKIAFQMDENLKAAPVHQTTKLRPPPYYSTHANLTSMAPGLYIPLLPCQFQPNQTKNRKVVTRPEEDPFMAALIECTKPLNEEERLVKKEKKTLRRNRSRVERLTLGLGLSCKSSTSVREGNLVKLSKRPELDRED